ncbi:uclacyanin 1-like [Aristolochia californica]|uniref:uclacyanin 1-like n=1 Tax=Aristolochia californica TaxID=171875 RepID=UPI0035DAC3DC
MALIKMQFAHVALAVLVVFPALFIASATEFIVGDDSGWTIDVDYEAWARGKRFYVGDTLVFNYDEAYHSVVKVNGTGFAQCIVSPNNGVFTTGSDRITLTTPGKKWYICGVDDHCSYYGQKLKITVLPRGAYLPPAPAPSVAPSQWVLIPELPAPWPAPVGAQVEVGDDWETPAPAPSAAPSQWVLLPEVPASATPAPWWAPSLSPMPPALVPPPPSMPAPWAAPADDATNEAEVPWVLPVSPVQPPAWWSFTPESPPAEPPYY